MCVQLNGLYVYLLKILGLWNFGNFGTPPSHAPSPVRRINWNLCGFQSIYAYILYIFLFGTLGWDSIYKTVFVLRSWIYEYSYKRFWVFKGASQPHVPTTRPMLFFQGGGGATPLIVFYIFFFDYRCNIDKTTLFSIGTP